MALDMDKYRRLFLEESAEHLGEISRALLELEKDSSAAESIDVIFRMAHSLKSMAASLGYDPISEFAHRMEDRMEGVRSRGRLADGQELGLLFKGLEELERLVEVVRETGEPPPYSAELYEAFGQAPAPAAAPTPEAAAPAEAAPSGQKKKSLS